MLALLQHLAAFILALGLLVAFHEFGHFWVARKCDVKILRFSIGFGKPLWLRHFGKDRSELVVAAIPLGGYVQMLDEREGEVSAQELERAFNRKPLSQRTAIVLAGPVFNFLFAIGAFWLMFLIGLVGLKPIVGEVAKDSIADLAGLESDMEIIAVDSRETKTWTMVVNALIGNIMDNNAQARVTVRAETTAKVLNLDLQDLTIDDLAKQNLLESMGMQPKQFKQPAVVGKVQAGFAADRAGLMAGDQIIAVDSVLIDGWRQWVQHIQAHPETPLQVEIMRNNNALTLELIPEPKQKENGQVIGFIGAVNQPMEGMLALEAYPLLPAFTKAVERTFEVSWLTLRMLGKILVGQASIKNLSGPISIAQYAGDSAQRGLAPFLWFLGVVSVSLGVLNLLPIPLLDGGHLMYYIIEFCKGSAVSNTAEMIGQRFGITLLLSLMVLVFYNDLVRLLS